jgi:glutamine synthetase adenylyltransferase
MSVMALSPFLSHQIERQPALLESLFDEPVSAKLDAILARTEAMRRRRDRRAKPH